MKEKRYRNDMLYEKYSHLCNFKFKAWYLKCFYYIAEHEIHRIAEEAEKSSDDPETKKKTFSRMLKGLKNKL